MTPRRINFAAIKSSSATSAIIALSSPASPISHVREYENEGKTQFSSLSTTTTPRPSKMTSSHSPNSSSGQDGESFFPAASRSNRRRKRCIFNRCFTKTGMFLILGAIILTGLPTKGSCRPVEEDYVYGSRHPSAGVNSKSEDEEAIGSRFEFQRKIVSTRVSTSSDDSDSNSSSSDNDNDDNVHSLELISGNSNGESDENPLLSNSSMIVHVIVTSSSSSTSSSELETETDPQDDSIQYTVEVRENNEEEGSPEAPQKQDLSREQQQQHPHPQNENQSGVEPTNADQLELQKLPKREEDDSSPRPVQDIFSAFYSAFTQPSSTPPPTETNEDDGDANSSITTFALPQPQSYIRTRRLPQGFLSLQQRRRLFLNRQRQLERKSFSQSDKREDKQHQGVIDVEETQRKLEFLAKKLDNSDHNKILEPSPSSVVETSSAVPFLQSSSSSTFSTLVPPPKIAVSVAVSHSESVGGGKKAATSTIDLDHNGDESEPRQKNAKSETISAEGERKVFSNAHSSASAISRTSRLPSRRPKPLIKSLPKYEADYEEDDDGHINNKNGGNKNSNFPRNFSSGLDSRRAIFPERAYNRRTTKQASEKTNDGDNFHSLRNRHNIIAFSEDGGRTSDSASSLSSSESSSFDEETSSRRKIARTVSGEIGDPSTYPFNLPANNFQFRHKKSQVASTTTNAPPAQPKVVNWQQPEQIWGEPAKVWGLPAEVWGEPERVWGEPAKVWASPDNIWPNSPKQKRLTEDDLDAMMQSDQPPEDRGPEGEEASTKEKGDEHSPRGTFVILGDDENEGDSIDGDLGRPLMLHHFTIPPKPKETVSVSTSVSSSVSSTKNNEGGDASAPIPLSRKVADFPHPKPSSSVINSQFTSPTTRLNRNSNSSSYNASSSSSSSESDSEVDPSGKKSGKKFGYVIEGSNVRKYRVEERTPDGYIVGEYGVLNNQNAFLRGVRYTADGTINPRLIHEALMKFLSLRR